MHFTNSVIQPGNLALRNAWLSGGIEWNFGALGHHYFTCDNIFAAILKDSENNELLYTYKTDLRRQHSDADCQRKIQHYYLFVCHI